MATNELSRRDVLGLIGIGALSVGALGYGAREIYERYIMERTIPAYNSDQFPTDEALIPPVEGTSYDTNPDPLFRAGNISMVAGVGIYGHAALIEHEGDFILSTAEHVADATMEATMPFVQIPGVGMTPIVPERFVMGRKDRGEAEASTFYIFGEQIQTQLRQAVAEEIIQPMKLTNARPRVYEVIAIPRGEKGDYAYYRFVTHHRKDNLLELESTPDICRGDSGAPLLKISEDGKTLTGESYGTLLGSKVTSNASYMKDCSWSIVARPND